MIGYINTQPKRVETVWLEGESVCV